MSRNVTALNLDQKDALLKNWGGGMKRRKFTVMISVDRLNPITAEPNAPGLSKVFLAWGVDLGPGLPRIPEIKVPSNHAELETPVRVEAREHQDDRNPEFCQAPNLWLYRGKLVLAENVDHLDEKDVAVLVQHTVLKEEKAFEKIKSDVAQFKEFEKSTPKHRSHISHDVRRSVWRRDEGRCVECRSSENLEYDHVIPVSKGGSSTERNLQLLCESCNRAKGASI